MPKALSKSPKVAADSKSSATKLFIFDTHPIQYRAPVFRELYQSMPNLRVFYFAEKFDGDRWWFHEIGKIPEQHWNVELKAGYENKVVERKRPGLWGFVKAANQILVKERPQAILIFGYYLPEHWALWWLAQYQQIPLLFIGEIVDRGTEGVRAWVRSALQTLFFRGISQFVSIGEKSRQFYQRFSIDSEKITPGRYCIDTTFFDMGTLERKRIRSSLRKELEIPADAFVILLVGRLFERKRPQDILRLHQLLKDESNTYSVIVGNGPLEEQLKQQAQGEDRIRLVGFKDQTQIKTFYAMSDLLVVPSEYETWGLVANEAAAMGLPVVMTETCGAAGDLILTNRTGFVYPVGDMERAAHWIRQLIRRPEMCLALGETAQKKVKSQYRVDQFAQAIRQATAVLIDRRLRQGQRDFY